MERQRKLYTSKSIALATFVGGPLGGGYLVSRNFSSLGENDSARTALHIGIISTLLLFGVLFLLSERTIERIPRLLIPLIYTGVVFHLAEKYQGERIRAHLAAGGEKASGWKAAGVGLICLLITLGFVFLLSLFTMPMRC